MMLKSFLFLNTGSYIGREEMLVSYLILVSLYQCCTALQKTDRKKLLANLTPSVNVLNSSPWPEITWINNIATAHAASAF